MRGSYIDESEITVDLEVDKKTGLYYRPGSSDLEMLRDCTGRDYKMIKCQGEVVLDLGGNIGGFMYRAGKDGAASVVSFEPEPNNYDLLLRNKQVLVEKFPATRFYAYSSAVYDKDGEMELMIRSGHYGACTPSLTRQGRKTVSSVKVKVVAMESVLDSLKPTFIKIDVEGAEYGILKDDLPAYVKHLAFEFHGQSVEDRKAMFDLVAKLKNDHWEVVDYREKKIFGTIQLLTGYFKR